MDQKTNDANTISTESWPSKGTKVYVIPPVSTENLMFKRYGFEITGNINEANIMVWTGGADVSPMYYGEKALLSTHSNPQRDVADIRCWRLAPKNCFKVGICRGGQLLNVLNGGRLWQDVDGHTGSHNVTDVKTGRVRSVSSTHHQMFIPAPDAEIVAVTRRASRKQNENISWKRPLREPTPDSRNFEFGTDYEVLFYPETRSLCFQPHPEYVIPRDTEEYFFEVLKRYL